MSKRPFIIDCDTGTDDAIAILAAYGCPDMDILAITSVNGNVAEKYTSANNLNLVEYLGKETKVARGAALPLYTRGLLQRYPRFHRTRKLRAPDSGKKQFYS